MWLYQERQATPVTGATSSARGDDDRLYAYIRKNKQLLSLEECPVSGKKSDSSYLKTRVSLDSRVREIINRNMVDPTPHTFDEAQLQIYTLMHRDSYPRFINSDVYKRLAQLNNNSSGTSSNKKESST
ncbi:regulator of G-protein signaling 4-like [Oratosquilla oratoria]|uniref:regulator of G-protein signaling 4-like n=1 Tax=Oratosquilla oratoria TaxID=337810 RepID=UPI003F75AC3F